MKTNCKYTVILSASSATASTMHNLIESVSLEYSLANIIYTDYINAVGVYQGTSEQSYVVHTNSSNVVGQLARLACEEFKQECILVSNNRKHCIHLQYGDNTKQVIGKRFALTYKQPTSEAYTMLIESGIPAYYEVK